MRTVETRESFLAELGRGSLLTNKNNWWLFKSINGDPMMAHSMEYPLNWQPAVIGNVDFPMSVITEGEAAA
jgi:hypothetical protein